MRNFSVCRHWYCRKRQPFKCIILVLRSDMTTCQMYARWCTVQCSTVQYSVQWPGGYWGPRLRQERAGNTVGCPLLSLFSPPPPPLTPAISQTRSHHGTHVIIAPGVIHIKSYHSMGVSATFSHSAGIIKPNLIKFYLFEQTIVYLFNRAILSLLSTLIKIT